MPLSIPGPAFWLLVTGSRSITDVAFVESRLGRMLSRKDLRTVVLVHGDCKTGVDAIADMWGRERALWCDRFPADWEKYGKAAGMVRNGEMESYVKQKPARGCVAFWDGVSRGTKNCFEFAINDGIPTVVYQCEVEAGLVKAFSVRNEHRSEQGG